MPPQARVVCVGDVASGEDVRIGRTQVLVDGDPVVDLEAGRCSEFGARTAPMPTMIMSASILVSSLRMTPVTCPCLPVSSAAVVR
jgi:hypothetical protein